MHNTGESLMRRRPIARIPLRSYAVLALLALGVALWVRSTDGGSFNTPVATPREVAPSVPAGQALTSGAAAPTSPLAKPIQLIDLAQRTLRAVDNYSCLMAKQERVRGRLEPDNLIELKIRHRPFSVYMRWLGPRWSVGQEVCYVAGRNQDMMRVHAAGLKGLVGFVSISPDSPMVQERSHHRISDAGLANLTARLAAGWKAERSPSNLQVRIAEYELNHRRCDRVEITRRDPTIDPSASCRTVVYFDKQNHLPVRLERYDWPCSGGPAPGELQECYSYLNLRFNVEMPDKLFDR
jgi:hypothetical protein